MYFELLFPNLLSKFRLEASLSFGSRKFEIFKNFRVFEHSSSHAGSTKRLMDLLFIPSDRKLSEESKAVFIFVLGLIVFEITSHLCKCRKKFWINLKAFFRRTIKDRWKFSTPNEFSSKIDHTGQVSSGSVGK